MQLPSKAVCIGALSSATLVYFTKCCVPALRGSLWSRFCAFSFFKGIKQWHWLSFKASITSRCFFSARSLHNTITLSGSLQCFYPSLQPPRSCSHPPLLSRWHYSPALCASLGLDLLSSSGLWQGTYHWIKQWAIHDMG